MRGFLNRRVAVPTVHSKLARVYRVAKWNGLRRLIADRECLRTEAIGHEEDRVERDRQRSNNDGRKQKVRPPREEKPAHLWRSSMGRAYTPEKDRP